ncbi:MAG TPA: hypothetical protein VES21_04005, partial [Nocardioidaceae bacterium]|nr:hypothetical protein [Nocardioidaceae bacterium]
RRGAGCGRHVHASVDNGRAEHWNPASQARQEQASPPRRRPRQREGPSYGLSANLMCSDLYARGVSYPDAVAYWWTYGAPDRMDIDLNGIPCETVYSVYDVNAFWY